MREEEILQQQIEDQLEKNYKTKYKYNQNNQKKSNSGFAATTPHTKHPAVISGGLAARLQKSGTCYAHCCTRLILKILKHSSLKIVPDIHRAAKSKLEHIIQVQTEFYDLLCNFFISKFGFVEGRIKVILDWFVAYIHTDTAGDLRTEMNDNNHAQLMDDQQYTKLQELLDKVRLKIREKKVQLTVHQQFSCNTKNSDNELNTHETILQSLKNVLLKQKLYLVVLLKEYDGITPLLYKNQFDDFYAKYRALDADNVPPSTRKHHSVVLIRYNAINDAFVFRNSHGVQYGEFEIPTAEFPLCFEKNNTIIDYITIDKIKQKRMPRTKKATTKTKKPRKPRANAKTRKLIGNISAVITDPDTGVVLETIDGKFTGKITNATGKVNGKFVGGLQQSV